MYLDLDGTNFDPYEEAEEDIADYLTETFAKIYKNATPEIVVKTPPPGGMALPVVEFSREGYKIIKVFG